MPAQPPGPCSREAGSARTALACSLPSLQTQRSPEGPRHLHRIPRLSASSAPRRDSAEPRPRGCSGLGEPRPALPSSEVPASTRDKALFHCTTPSGVPRGPYQLHSIPEFSPLASRVAQGVSGPPSSCVWNPRVFADPASTRDKALFHCTTTSGVPRGAYQLHSIPEFSEAQ